MRCARCGRRNSSISSRCSQTTSRPASAIAAARVAHRSPSRRKRRAVPRGRHRIDRARRRVLGPLDMIFVSADEPPFRLQAQDDGAEVILLQLPLKAEAYVGHGWSHSQKDAEDDLWTDFRPLDGVRVVEFSVQHCRAGRDDDPRATGRGRREDRTARRRRRARLAAESAIAASCIATCPRQARRRDRLEERGRRRGGARVGPSATVVLQTMRPGVADRIGIGEPRRAQEIRTLSTTT